MNGKIFTNSFSWVIVAFLFVLAFFRGVEQSWFLAAILVIWIIYLSVRTLLPKLKPMAAKATLGTRNQKRRHKKKTKPISGKEPAAVAVEGPELERLLLGHVSCRISEKLKSAYPDATWQWDEPHPESIVRGGTMRIKTSNTEDYTHAEVTVVIIKKPNPKCHEIFVTPNKAAPIAPASFPSFAIVRRVRREPNRA